MANHFKTDGFLMVNMLEGNLLERTDDFDEFKKSYKIFNDLTNSYKNELDTLKEQLSKSTKPLIATEGKTEWKHLKKALEILGGAYPALSTPAEKRNDLL